MLSKKINNQKFWYTLLNLKKNLLKKKSRKNQIHSSKRLIEKKKNKKFSCEKTSMEKN